MDTRYDQIKYETLLLTFRDQSLYLNRLVLFLFSQIFCTIKKIILIFSYFPWYIIIIVIFVIICVTFAQLFALFNICIKHYFLG